MLSPHKILIFSLELVAKCKQLDWGLSVSSSSDNFASIKEVDLNLNASAFLYLVEQRVEANLVHAQILGTQGDIRYDSPDSADPWRIILEEGLKLTIEDLSQNYGLQSQASQSIRGQITLGIPTAKVKKNILRLEGGGSLEQNEPAILTNTSPNHLA